MNNKKSKIESFTSVSDLVKPKKIKIETSVSNLIKSKMANSIKSKKTKIADLIKLKKRYLYPCHCIRCDGMEVDFRTQENHTTDKSLWNSEDTRKIRKILLQRENKKNLSLFKT